MSRLLDRLSRAVGDLRPEYPMSRLTTMRTGGPCLALAMPRDSAELAAVIEVLVGEGAEFRVLGGGSNVVALPEGRDTVVLKLGRGFDRSLIEGDTVRVGAASSLPRLCRDLAQAGYAGFEFAAGIPGTVGGALAVNAGAYGVDCLALLDRFELIEAGSPARLAGPEELGARYRETRLKARDDVVITEAVFRVHPDLPSRIRARMDALRARRVATQPSGASSAGCIFKNPPQGPGAGALIDSAGLKGTRRGHALVSPVHANFIVNDGGRARAEDVMELMGLVKDAVLARHGVDLELEVQMLGARA